MSIVDYEYVVRFSRVNGVTLGGGKFPRAVVVRGSPNLIVCGSLGSELSGT